ncbi:hypothetical protein niasHT_032406 [Heterodera trifolii]|uniref:Lipoprotein n=1 Tax=Heterodera trifolii TaxID=157864 RepID=A0ABD2HZW0_9BILA
MKSFFNFPFVFCVLLLIGCVDKCVGGVAALPPKYLGIENHDKCLTDEPIGSSRRLCLPAQKKSECPDETLKALNDLEEGQHPPTCA